MANAPSTNESRRRILELAQGYRVTQVLHAAVSLRIAEALSDGCRGSDHLAAAVGVPQAALVRLLRALVSLGLVTQDGENDYRLTDAGTLLDGRHPSSVRATILFESSALYQNWSDFSESLRTGENVYRRRYGVDAWAYRARNPEWGKLFDDAMQELSAARVGAVLDAYDFSGLETIIDIGGGRGSLLAGILKAHPTARGVLFDQPVVVAEASTVLTAIGVAERCAVVGGNFFDRVPPGGDAYILSVVIHDWDDEPATAILATCRGAMSPSSRLLLIERVLPNRPDDDVSAYLQDLNMLHSLSGRERSEAEYRALLARGGFRLAKIVPTQSPFAVIEASPDLGSARSRP